MLKKKIHVISKYYFFLNFKMLPEIQNQDKLSTLHSNFSSSALVEMSFKSCSWMAFTERLFSGATQKQFNSKTRWQRESVDGVA